MNHHPNYKWNILVLATLTNALVMALPGMSLSVLFPEISRELHLSVVQVGIVWGIASLPAIFTSLFGGAIGDRFGPERVLSLGCLLVGLSGGLRGLSQGFGSLVASVVLLGSLMPLILVNVFKTCGVWFPRKQLGLANGFLSMGMALGFLAGSMISATVLSPWLGGWRNVLFLYGGIAMLFSVPWAFVRRAPNTTQETSDTGITSLRQTIMHVIKLRDVWLLGFSILVIGGCIQAVLGYLPLYLRGLGWPAVSADGALASFHTVSMICVIPIALLSDRLGERKKLLLVGGLMFLTGIGLLSVVNGIMIWVAVGLAGMVRDGFMAIFMTMIVETDGVGPAYVGTATGFVMIFSFLGNVLAPPLGNSFAEIAPSAPFVFWAILIAAGIFGLSLTRRPQGIIGRKRIAKMPEN
ncbi:MAG: MFS transporter [Chloroflexota bacterium]